MFPFLNVYSFSPQVRVARVGRQVVTTAASTLFGTLLVKAKENNMDVITPIGIRIQLIASRGGLALISFKFAAVSLNSVIFFTSCGT